MEELIKTRCKEGWLLITEEAIIVELTTFGKTLKSEMMLRSAFVDLDAKAVGMTLLYKKPAMNLTFHGQGGKVIMAGMVKGEDAQKIITLLLGSG